MDIDLDLDAFIAGIEETAPEVEEIDQKVPRCQECDTMLEEIDGDFICPNCNVQATNILQLEETEMQYNEDGRAIIGQRVSLYERRKKRQVDYGWAWSTDEAILHILGLQVKALKQLGIINEAFCIGIKNMWHQFWLQNIAPHIQDQYVEGDFIPISVKKALKLRDIEILYKVRDKVMIPKQTALEKRQCYKNRKMMDTQFVRFKPLKSERGVDTLNANSVDELEQKSLSSMSHLDIKDLSPTKQEVGSEAGTESPEPNGRKTLTNHCNLDSISILTLNRTLAFIEATARCTDMLKPIFASDIIRACCQRLIPFFGVHKTLPEEMKINPLDKLMFQKNRPPSPTELTTAGTKLIRKLYCEQFPFHLPTPNLENILQRFIDDMNLPHDLMNHIDDRVTFHSFRKSITKMEFTATNHKVIPQFNKIAYAILMIHLKRLFVFDDEEIYKICDSTREKAQQTGQNLFIVDDWIRQMSAKLQLILIYDPFSLFHPMANTRNLYPSSQIYKYIEMLFEDKVVTATRTSANQYPIWDESFRAELSDFLQREIPRPPGVAKDTPIDDELERPDDLMHPIKEAFSRTQRFWISEVNKDEDLTDLLFREFQDSEIFALEHQKTWCAFDTSKKDNIKPQMNPDWPKCFKLLLSIGGYLCYCEPRELLREYRLVEAYLYPNGRILRRQGAS